MATLAPPVTGLRSCSEVYSRQDGEPDRTPRHTISEVAAASGLSAHTLRWYERIGLLDPIDRSYSGQRRYCDGDLHRLAFLGRLRLTGMSVADMLRYVELARLGEQTVGERRELLVAHREEVRLKLADLHATLAVLDYKIDLYSRTQPAGCTPPAGEQPAGEHPAGADSTVSRDTRSQNTASQNTASQNTTTQNIGKQRKQSA